LLLPALIAILAVQVGPMLVGVAMGFLQLTQFTIGHWTTAPFAGLTNFRLAVDVTGPVGKQVLQSFAYTCAYTVCVVLISWVFAVAGSVFLSDNLKGRSLVRSLFLVPYAIPGYIGAVVWLFMFLPTGAVNTLLGRDLHMVGDQTFWLAGGKAFWLLGVASVWATWPFSFLLMLASVQGVQPELYEAARVDGASRWQEFRRITLPSVRGVSLLVILVTGFYAFNNFTTPYIMFGTSPPTQASLISLQIYVNSFVDLNFGLGEATSTLMIVFLIIVSVVYMKVLHVSPRGAADAR
jgi:multiple sugar transport system permease protein